MGLLDITITDLTSPPALDGPEAWLLEGASDVHRTVRREIHGDEDLAYSAQEMWADLRHQSHETKHRLVASDTTGEVIGTATVLVSRVGNTHAAVLGVDVLSRARHHGIGSALLETAEGIAARAGCRTVLVESDHAREPAEGEPGALTALTGSGRVPGADPLSRLVTRRGYVLAQVERQSVLRLPVEAGLLDRVERVARATAGADYRVVTWAGPCPEEWVGHIARLRTLMTTDVPLGGLELGEDAWDAARVRADEDALQDAGWTRLTTAAEHVATGALVAFTVIDCPGRDERVALQEDTLVEHGHRGHRLGWWIKAENLRRLAALRRRTERVHTGNAVENAPMLAINETLGFRPAGVTGEWQRRLPAG